MNYTVRDKQMEVVLLILRIQDNVSILSVCLTVFPLVLQTLNYFPVAFSLANAAYHHYSFNKILLYHLFESHTRNLFLSVSNKNYFLRDFKFPLHILVCAIFRNLLIERSLRSLSVSIDVAVNHFTKENLCITCFHA